MDRKFYVAGVQHHQMYKVLKDLEVGSTFDLIREPDNKFDPNAVRLEFEQTMCGFVPRKFSPEASALLEAGEELTCEIIELNKGAKPWEQCKVRLCPPQDDETEGDWDYERNEEGDK